ncbi:hypothetical protein HY468_01190 [Candidatus Roizmanbacteria bacterium]|nr:hypothetical protein [Candidatus Roizmanbacteria bacterium]
MQLLFLLLVLELLFIVPASAQEIPVSNGEDSPNSIKFEMYHPPTPTVTPTRTPTPTQSQSPVLPTYPPGTPDMAFAALYGRPRGWGTLARATTPEKAIEITKTYATRVAAIRGGKPTVGLVNLNISSYPKNASARLCVTAHMNRDYIIRLIQLAKANGMYVMLDVQTGPCNPTTAMQQVIDAFLIADNVFFDIDLEWIEYQGAGSLSAGTIQEITRYYNTKRVQKGYATQGYVGFYIFQFHRITNAAQLQGDQRGSIIALFDGWGACAAKAVGTRRMLSLYGKPYAGMEFQTKFGGSYDSCSAQNYFSLFPDFTMFLAQ